jgi:hypothetical protein
MSGAGFTDVPFLDGMRMHEIDSLTGSQRQQLQTWLVMRPVSGLAASNVFLRELIEKPGNAIGAGWETDPARGFREI